LRHSRTALKRPVRGALALGAPVLVVGVVELALVFALVFVLVEELLDELPHAASTTLASATNISAASLRLLMWM
jgi:hypothetical protein